MMIETILRNYLIAALHGVAVYIEVPKDNSAASYVVIERTGGGAENHIRNATVAIQSYGATMYGAAELHESVLAAMRNITALDTVSACSLNSEYNFTDATAKEYRYQAVFDLVYY